jgi:hypothetical protein
MSLCLSYIEEERFEVPKKAVLSRVCSCRKKYEERKKGKKKEDEKKLSERSEFVLVFSAKKST